MNAFRKPRRKAVVRNLIAELDPLNDAFRHHVLYGEEDGDRGGHAFSSTRIGKTVFPERWSETEVIEAVLVVMNKPQRALDLRSRLILLGVVDDVLIEVSFKKTKRGYQLQTAFPRNGSGVEVNTAFGRRAVPLDKSILES